MSVGTGATAVSTSTGVGFGLLAGSYSVSATAASSRTDYAISGGTLITAFSFKFHVPTAFATTKRVFSLVNSAAAVVLTVNLNGSTGQIQVQDSASTTASSVSSAWTTGVTYRIELLTVVDTATTGFYNLNLYANDGKTPLVAAVTRSNANMSTAALATIQAGIVNNGTTVAANVILDSVRYEVGGTAELGPETIAVTAAGTAGIGGSAAGVKAAPAVTTAPLGLVGVVGAGKAIRSVGRATAGLTARGTSVKRATVAGRATVGVAATAVGRKVSAAATVRALLGLGGTVGGRKVAAGAGRSTLAFWGALGPVVIPPTIGTHTGTEGPRASLVGDLPTATMLGTTDGGSSLIGGIE
jgi:hypothetical protein